MDSLNNSVLTRSWKDRWKLEWCK